MSLHGLHVRESGLIACHSKQVSEKMTISNYDIHYLCEYAEQ